jgi:hypothetical protein
VVESTCGSRALTSQMGFTDTVNYLVKN